MISLNIDQISFGEDLDIQEQMNNILLLKGESKQMGDYLVTYEGEELKAPNRYYKVKYELKDKETGEIKEIFTLKPNAQINPEMGLVANPSTKRYLTKDVFTHVTSVPDNSNKEDSEIERSVHEVAVGDTFFGTRHFIVLESFVPNPTDSIDYVNEAKIGVGLNLKVQGFDNKVYRAQPVYLINVDEGNKIYTYKDRVIPEGLTFSIINLDPKTEKIKIALEEDDPADDFIIMKAIVFPYINVLWLGCIIMFIGFMISMINRRKQIRHV